MAKTGWPKIRERSRNGKTYYVIDAGRMEGKRILRERADKKARQPKRPHILTLDESERLIGAADRHAPEIVPWLAVSLFCGLRPDEAAHLDWKDVELGDEHADISVRAEPSKVNFDRFVVISDNTKAWLKMYAQDIGPIRYSRRLWEKIRAKANVKCDRESLRHTYGSYHLAMHEDEAATLNQMGTSRQMLFTHYRRAVRQGDATRFWSIFPIRWHIMRLKFLPERANCPPIPAPCPYSCHISLQPCRNGSLEEASCASQI